MTQAILATALAAGLLAVGCGDDTGSTKDGGGGKDVTADKGGGDMGGGDGGIPTGDPSITITAPTNGMTIMGTSTDVTWMAANWKGFPPMDPGCPATSNNCGHVHLRIAPKANATADADFMPCNAMGKPYNNAGGMPLKADFSLCTGMAPADGMYTIEVELRHNDHTPLSPAKKNSVTVKVGGGGMGAPTITITDPTPNQMLTLDSNKEYAVKYSATNWTGGKVMMNGMLPDGCNDPMAATWNNCGHVHLTIDGMACNDTANSKPYNNAPGMMGTLNAKFGLCPMQSGMHTIELELRHADHSPLTPAVKTSVMVQVP
jgi:hypothetical protein